MHSGPRSATTPLRFHIGLGASLFKFEGGTYVFHPELVTPEVAAALGDYFGGQVTQDAAQYPNIPYPADPDAPNPGGTTPPPGDPEATFTARAKVGQNCAWGTLITPAEQNWAVGKWGADASRRINFYAVGGANVQERDNHDGTYSFVKFADGFGTFYPDIDGAGDAWVAHVVAPTPLPPALS